MKAAQLREHTAAELDQLLEEAMQELFELRVKSGQGDASAPPLKRRTLRREVARIKTVMRERERAAGEGPKGI